jgi:hypothetical protein
MTPTLAEKARALADRAAKRHPQLRTRAYRAAEIIERCEFEHVCGEFYLIRELEVTPDKCDCLDFTEGTAPTLGNGRRYCKHILAVLMLEKLVAEEPRIHTPPLRLSRELEQALLEARLAMAKDHLPFM